MLGVKEIIQTALREHDGDNSVEDEASFIAGIEDQLRDPTKIPSFSRSSTPLTLVRFKCMLQDTGYPMEVYMQDPPAADEAKDVDWSKLKERWVGWATEIPGSRGSTSRSFESAVGELSMDDVKPLHESLRVKYPVDNQGDYAGALLKIYDETTFKPTSLVEVVGIVSSAPMPSATGSDEDEDPIMVPCIHVLLPPTPAFAIPTRALADPASTRTKLLKHLASSFSPLDRLAAEYLLLLLLSSPTVRPTSLPPLGTISINFLAPSTSRRILESSLRSLMPMVVDLPLSIPLLHSTKFQPHSPDSTKLNAGRLQLGHGTVIMIEEDAMGEGGKLEEKAVKNLKALSDCMTTQTLGYEYPYMDSLRMKCCLRPLVLSEGKSLLPVDVHLPLLPASETSTEPSEPTEQDLEDYRTYLAQYASPEHAAKLEIPDKVADIIQESFVTNRKSGGGDVNAAEGKLKRQMRIARLLALSHAEAKLSEEVWNRAVEMDTEAEQRMESVVKSKSSKQTNGTSGPSE